MPRGRRGNDPQPVVAAHLLLSQTLAAGLSSFHADPNSFGTGVQSISDAFELYRWRKCKFRVFAATTGAAVCALAGYPNTFPASNVGVMESVAAVTHLGPVETQWSRWVTVPREVLAGEFPWYHTRLGTFTTAETYAWSLGFAGTGTNIVNVEILGEIQFKDLVNTSATPMAIAHRRQERDEAARLAQEAKRAEVLTLIAAGSAAATRLAP